MYEEEEIYRGCGVDRKYYISLFSFCYRGNVVFRSNGLENGWVIFVVVRVLVVVFIVGF